MRLFGWFREKEVEKPKEEPLKERTKKLVYEEETFEVGKTYIELLLKDERKFTTSVLGYVSQYTSTGEPAIGGVYYRRSAIEPKVTKVEVVSSSVVAKHFVQDLLYAERTYVNEIDNPTESVMGQAIQAKIKKTVSSTIVYPVGKVVDKTEEDYKNE